MELKHHGIKGQKWGVRRFQDYDGHRIKDSDSYIIRKGSKFNRYSPQKEDLKVGSYVSKSKHDASMYMNDVYTNGLGFHGYKGPIYQQTIKNLDPVKVRTGNAVIKDILNRTGDKKMSTIYKELFDLGYFNESADAFARWGLIKDSNDLLDKRAELANFIHKDIYKNRKAFANRYKKQGYDAIKDPEDLTWNYESAKIVLDPKKFKTVKARKLTKKDEDYIRKKYHNDDPNW